MLTILAGIIAAGVVAQASPTPTPTPNPLTVSGYVRSFYFTRQNASNNPGVRFDYTPGAKYNGNAVNQASFNNGADLHGDYHFAGGGWHIGGDFFYGNTFGGPCVVPANHAHGGLCVTQVPPNTNADDTLPGFMMATFDQAYLAYKQGPVDGTVGNMFFNSPWANTSDSRLKPAAFQGADIGYKINGSWNVELADMIEFQNRTSATFGQSTLLTSYPAGGGGLAGNIVVPGGHGINTGGFFMGKIGYASPKSQTNALDVDGYLYSVSDIVNMYWGDAKYTFGSSAMKPYLALQGGWENNAGASVVGKIASSLIGAQLGATAYDGKLGNVVVTAGFDTIPWKNDSIYLPSGVSCSDSTYQISAKKTLAYFLPTGAPQCYTNAATGLTNVYYGGWASPYTDNYATDPLFTTQISQGMADRRAPGNSYKIGATWTSRNKRLVLIASDAWYNYGNALLSNLTTNEWNLDGTYYLNPVRKGAYKGFLVRYRFASRTIPNGFTPTGSGYLGGLPLFKYNRAQLQYTF